MFNLTHTTRSCKEITTAALAAACVAIGIKNSYELYTATVTSTGLVIEPAFINAGLDTFTFRPENIFG